MDFDKIFGGDDAGSIEGVAKIQHKNKASVMNDKNSQPKCEYGLPERKSAEPESSEVKQSWRKDQSFFQRDSQNQNQSDIY